MQFILANLKYKFSAICCSIFQQKKKILKCFSNFNNYFRFFSFSFSLRYYFYPSFFPGTYLKFAFETRRKTSQPVLQQKSLLAQKKLWLAYCFISFCFCSYFCQHQNHQLLLLSQHIIVHLLQLPLFHFLRHSIHFSTFSTIQQQHFSKKIIYLLVVLFLLISAFKFLHFIFFFYFVAY